MALTFPREVPGYIFRKCTWEVVEGVALNRTGSGRAISAVDQWNPYYRANFETRPMYPAERRQWSAWKNSLRGGMKSFLAYDASRPFPLAYPSGIPSVIANTWNGTGIAMALSARATTIEGVPAGYVATPGDHIGFILDGHYSVHEITEGGTANGSDELTVSFDPYIALEMFSIGATAVLWRPKARFILDPATWEESADIDFSPISFAGLQVF